MKHPQRPSSTTIWNAGIIVITKVAAIMAIIRRWETPGGKALNSDHCHVPHFNSLGPTFHVVPFRWTNTGWFGNSRRRTQSVCKFSTLFTAELVHCQSSIRPRNHHCCSTWNTSYHHCWGERWLHSCGSKQCFVWLCRRPWIARKTRYWHDSGTIHFASRRFWSWCEFSAARQTPNSDQWDGSKLSINLFESAFNR